MIFGFIALLISFFISVISIYFSVTGWMALFSAAAWGAMFMFGSIEIGKIVGVSLLHWFWKELPTMHKFILSMMVIISMFLTSIGIFGYLSKGYLDQSVPVNNAELKIERIDQQLNRYNSTIKNANDQLNQLDSVIQTLIKYDKISGKDGAREVRKKQQSERNFLNTQIEESSTKIDQLLDKKIKYKSDISNTETKLGPIKYIIDLLGMSNKSDLAVQIVILVSIFVFDPFALMLLISGLWCFKNNKVDKKEQHSKKPIIYSNDVTIIEKNNEKYIDNTTTDSYDEITEDLMKNPNLVYDVEKEISKSDPELSKKLQPVFDKVKNQLQIKKDNGWLD